MTLLELLTASTGFLQRKGIESPRLNAEHLTAAALGCRRLDLYLRFDETLPESTIQTLREQVRLRGTGLPLQHILGTVEFLGRSFLCDARALIPRPETELLVTRVLARLSESPSLKRTLIDVGCGSGVISISLALALPGWEILATDLSADALALTMQNATALGASLRTMHSDLLSEVEDRSLGYVVANLPYIPRHELESLQPEVKHDPLLALDGGEDGLDLIRRLIEQLPSKLSPGGGVALEFGIHQGPQIAEYLAAQNFQDIRLERDYQEIERFAFGSYG